MVASVILSLSLGCFSFYLVTDVVLCQRFFSVKEGKYWPFADIHKSSENK